MVKRRNAMVPSSEYLLPQSWRSFSKIMPVLVDGFGTNRRSTLGGFCFGDAWQRAGGVVAWWRGGVVAYANRISWTRVPSKTLSPICNAPKSPLTERLAPVVTHKSRLVNPFGFTPVTSNNLLSFSLSPVNFPFHERRQCDQELSCVVEPLDGF